MNIVILSGGSGSRLWPLSNLSRSKQFLKLLENDQGEKESMAYQMYHRLEAMYPNANISFLASKVQENEIKQQIGERAKVVTEPSREGTFGAIVLACAQLLQENKIKDDDAVVIVPVDVSANEEYFTSLEYLKKVAEKEDVNAAVLGAVPTYPSAKYGYFLADHKKNKVVRLIEKVTEGEAEKLISKGAFWYTGAVAFKISYIKSLLQKVKPEFNLRNIQNLVENYSDFSKQRIQNVLELYGDKISCVIHEGHWKDIGTWNTLAEEIETNASGLVTLGEQCSNTHVINELSIPVVVLGASNLIVAASPDGILVSDKQKSSYIAPYIEQLVNRPMFEERNWGEYKVLDYEQFKDGERSLTKRLTVESGQKISYQSHTMRDEIWTIVDGEGELLIEGNITMVKRGDVSYIPKNQKHALRAVKTIQLIEVQIGSELIEEDICRYEWEWKN